jgi:hypothetical protein
MITKERYSQTMVNLWIDRRLNYCGCTLDSAIDGSARTFLFKRGVGSTRILW